MTKLRIAGNVQSGESLGETAVYNAMWSLAKEDQREDGKVTSKVISIGWERIARAASVSRNTAKKSCLSLVKKLNLKKIGEHNSAACKGAQYRIYSYPLILSRRRKAGLTHFINSNGKVTLVNPLLWNSATPVVELTPGENLPVVELTPGENLPGDPCQPLPGVPVVELTTPLVREEVKEEEEKQQSAQVAELIQMGAASQEPPVEMSMSLGSPEARSQISNREDHVRVVPVPHTSKEEVPATVSLGGSPSAQDENLEVVSSPRSWAGRSENQPAATKQTSPVPRPPSFEPAAAVEEVTVDPDAWIGKPAAKDEIPYKPTVNCDNVFTRDQEPTRPDQLDVPTIRAQHAVDQQAARDVEHAANMARINQEMAEAALAEAPALETMPDIVPVVEEPVAPPQYAPLTELITWQVQHGVRDVSVYMEVCGRDYPAVIRVVTELKKQNIIHMVDGGWEMVAADKRAA